MELDVILRQLEVMDNTASQAVYTDEEKKEIIKLLTHQVKELKTFIVKNIHAADCENDARSLESESTVPAPVTGIPEIGKRKSPDEDLSNTWNICACDKADCDTCNAEREAITAATQWFDSHTLDDIHYTEDSSCGKEDGRATDDFYSDEYTEAQSYLEMREILCQVDSSYWDGDHTSKYVIYFHPMLCVTHYHNYRGNPHACGVVTLLFAYKMATQTLKTFFTNSMLYMTKATFEIVSSSLQRGNEIYHKNYGTISQCLMPDELVLHCCHLGISLRGDFSTGSAIFDDLISAVMNLSHGEILLFIRMTKYNVWSMVRKGSTSLLIFDCQPHRLKEGKARTERLYGGILYYIHWTQYTVWETLKAMEKDSGEINGECKIAIVET